MFHGDGGGRRGKRSLAVGLRATFEKDRTGPLNAVHRRPAPGRTDCPVENTVLERKDIDPSCQDNEGRTPLRFAALRGEEGLFKMLLDRTNLEIMRVKRHILSVASRLGNEGAVKILLEQKDIDPNCQDNEDKTPLLLATTNGIQEAIKILLGPKDIDPTA